MKKNSKNFGFVPLFGILLILLLGCSPEKRMQRIVRKNPELITKDTISVVDTQIVVTNRVHSDTVTTLQNFLSDTIIIQKENLTVRTYVHKDSVFIDGECDTVRVQTIREIAIPVDRVEVKEVQSRWVLPLIFVCAFLSFTLIYSLRRK